MKKWYSLVCILYISVFHISVNADEWLDLAQDIQAHVEKEVPILSEDQKRIDANLVWAYQCMNKQ
jgi:hypothetical protein